MKMANPAAKRLIAKRLGRFFLPFLEFDLRFFPITSPFYSEKVRPPRSCPSLGLPTLRVWPRFRTSCIWTLFYTLHNKDFSAC
jgi:hypothetical protein